MLNLILPILYFKKQRVTGMEKIKCWTPHFLEKWVKLKSDLLLYGFWTNRSTSLAFMKIMEEIMSAIKRKTYTIVFFIDQFVQEIKIFQDTLTATKFFERKPRFTHEKVALRGCNTDLQTSPYCFNNPSIHSVHSSFIHSSSCNKSSKTYQIGCVFLAHETTFKYDDLEIHRNSLKMMKI